MRLELACKECGSGDFKKRCEYISRKEIEEIYECLRCGENIYVKYRMERKIHTHTLHRRGW